MLGELLSTSTMKTHAVFSAILFAALMHSALAKIKTETVEYKQGDTALEGFLAYDDASTKPRPGVLLIHDWMGVGDYAKSRATQLASVFLWGLMLVGIIIDSVILVLGVKKNARERFPNQDLGRIGIYSLMRSLQFRKWRLPKPRLKRGASF